MYMSQIDLYIIGIVYTPTIHFFEYYPEKDIPVRFLLYTGYFI